MSPVYKCTIKSYTNVPLADYSYDLPPNLPFAASDREFHFWHDFYVKFGQEIPSFTTYNEGTCLMVL